MSKNPTSAKRRGRPPIPLSTHLLRGTFRPSRHGARPPQGLPGPNLGHDQPEPVKVVGTLTGTALAAAIRLTWETSDIAAEVYVQAAASAFDRRQTLSALVGPMFAHVAVGGVSARALEVLLRAEHQAGADLHEAIDRLHLEDDEPMARERAS